MSSLSCLLFWISPQFGPRALHMERTTAEGHRLSPSSFPKYDISLFVPYPHTLQTLPPFPGTSKVYHFMNIAYRFPIRCHSADSMGLPCIAHVHTPHP